MAWFLAGVCIFTTWAALSFLPPLHPASLWTLVWTIATVLFALHLLPYAPLSTATVLVIIGALVSFAAGSIVGRGLAAGPQVRRRVEDWSETDRRVLSRAARWTVILGGILLVYFLVQVAASFGVGAVLRSSPNVRVAIQHGFASLSIKYIWFAIPVAALAALMAAIATDRRSRRRWALLALGAVVSGYFSTGRATPLLIGVVATISYLAGPGAFSPRRLLAAALGLFVFGLAIFLIGGALLGKTFENAPISSARSPLTTKRVLTPLALPYEYATAPIAALNNEVRHTPAVGHRYGCATVAPVCSALRAAGVSVTPEPEIRQFTPVPFLWNTYTGLDRPLIDGGFVLLCPILFLLGCLSGLVFAWAQRGYLVGVLLYGVVASCIVFSTGSNNFFAPHIAGSMIWIVTVIAAARAMEGQPQRRPTAQAVPRASMAE
jgi:hypothetical protein